ncbi:DUF2141 domain-containing protein [Novosphingobium sp. RD2P27]|uniref:DUF2141 domain-containing protein n=1 Tax=Novosphingobium kalidii TaxID=3230299 RepID=A0ABV2CWZ1_9SPHN
MQNRPRSLGALTLLAVLPAISGAALPSTDVVASVTGLRSTRGQILACLTARPEAFPGCDNDPDARRLTVPATTSPLRFGSVREGRYAVALIHDENGNGKLDKHLMIPREGFGFSQDAPAVMGPPRFSSASFPVGAADEHLSIKMRYMF